MSKRMMILRHPEWTEQLMCFAFKQECHVGFDAIAKFVDSFFRYAEE